MTRHFTQFLPGLFAFCLLVGCLSAADGWDNLNKRKGAEAMIRATIVNADGKTLENIPVHGYFYLYSQGKVNEDIVMTDADGKASIKGMCSSYNVAIELEKEGYYETSENIDMLGNDHPGDNIVGVKKDKWQPYGIEKTFVFKEIRKPIPLVLFIRTRFCVPEYEKEYGYDLEYGSFVEPYGDGKVAVFFVKYGLEKKPRENGKGTDLFVSMVIRFPNEKDGAYAFPMDTRCRLKSPYRARPEEEYKRELTFASSWLVDEDGILQIVSKQKMLPASQGLILRTRSVVDATGTLVSAHYSKIYGEIVVSIGLEKENCPCIGLWTGGVTTYFNPTENDTNLECDGKMHYELQKGKRDIDNDGVNGAL